MTRTNTALTLLFALTCVTTLGQTPCNLTVQPAALTSAIKTALTVTVSSTCALDHATFDVQPNGTTARTTEQLGSIAANEERTISYSSDTTGSATFRFSGFPSGCISCAPVQATSGTVTFLQFTLASLLPSAGTSAGGTPVTIRGANLDASCTAVTFGGTAGVHPAATSASTLTVTTPPAADASSPGSVPVMVTCSGVSQTVPQAFTYTSANPHIGDLTPSSGFTAGGDTVTIKGSEFTNLCTSVLFDAIPGSGTQFIDATTLRTTTPAQLAVGRVTVTLNCGASKSDAFTYLQAMPTVSAISPQLGPPQGGTIVSITGTNYTTQCRVRFGTLDAQTTVLDAGRITAVVPASEGGAAGVVAVSIDCGGSTALASNGFIYTAQPTVVNLQPPVIPESGGKVTLNGSFPLTCHGGTVWFGRQRSVDTPVITATSVIATAPAASPSEIPDTQDLRVPVAVDCSAGGIVTGNRSIPVLITYARAAFRFSRAAADGKADPVVGEDVTFTTAGLTTETVEDPVQTVTWDFGDGTNPGSGATTTHHFTARAAYRVKATVMYMSGVPSSTSRWVTVLADEQERSKFVPRLLLPAQAALAGANGAFFRSQAWLLNPHETEMVVRLRYVGGNNDGESSVAVTIPANGMLAYPDILAELFAKGGPAGAGGNVVVETLGPAADLPRATARTYNDAGGFGTFGQFVPSFPLDGSGAKSTLLSGLQHDGATNQGSRTNIGIVNPSSTKGLSVSVQAIGEDGVPIGTTPQPISVESQAFVQFSAGDLGVAPATPFSVLLISDDKFFAYASKIDNTTSDPIFIPSTLRARTQQWIHPVSRSEGGNALFSNSLLVARPSSAAQTAANFLRPLDSEMARIRLDERSRISATEVQVPIGAENGSRFYEDVFDNLAIAAKADLQYVMEIDSGVPAVAWSRAYSNPKKPDGTIDTSRRFGQLLPAFGVDDLIPAGGAVVQGVTELTNSDNSGYHTNMAFANVAQDGSVAGLKATLYVRNATTLRYEPRGTPYNMTLQTGQATEIVGHVVKTLFHVNDPVIDGYVVIQPDPGSEGKLFAWASLNDDRSTDSIYIRPLARVDAQLFQDVDQ